MSSSSTRKRHDNRRRVLEALRQHGAASRASLARSLGLSKVTLSAIAGEALEAGWVVECNSQPGGIGRRPVLLSLAPALGIVAAVDIHADSLSVRISDLCGEALAESTRSTPTQATPLQDRVLDELAAACRRCQRSTASLRAIALALPASIDTQGHLNAVGQPACLAEINWHTILTARFPSVSVQLLNNSNAAALAEHAEGTATDWASFAYLGIGQSGVGAGLVLDDELYRGSHHGAGEIGSLVLGDNEQTVDALVNLPRTTQFYRRLAQLVALMDHLLDLDGVVLYAIDLDHTTLRRELSPLLADHASRPIGLRTAALGAQAPLLGAARLAGEQAWNNLLAHYTYAD